MSKKNLFVILFLSVLLLIPFESIKAICPACTLTIGLGVGLSRWLGIDDTISGAWIGAIIISLSLWCLDWLNKKQIKFPLRKLAVLILMYLIVLLPLYWKGIIGHPNNTITVIKYCIDKILFGVFWGSIFFSISVWLYNFLKKKNNGKPHFPFEKIAIPVLLLLILSAILYFVSKCK